VPHAPPDIPPRDATRIVPQAASSAAPRIEPHAATEFPWMRRMPELMRPDEHLAIGSVPEPGPLPRIAVISGDARIGGLVARLLAEALDHEHHVGGLVRDAGADVEAPAWQPAVNWADQIILAVDAVGLGPSKAARLLDRTGLHGAMTVVMLPPPRRGLSRGHEDISAIRAHFAERTRSVSFVPNDAQPTTASIAAWQRIVADLASR
jgi:hypothetical protein